MEGKRQRRARAHHVLPQFYLRAWANDAGAVSTLSREGREFATGTAALGVETDFYTVTDSDGSPTSVVEEGLLRDWDAKGAAVHRRLLADDFPLDDDARMQFALWMGLQWLRGRAARQIGREFFDEFHKMLVSLGLDLPAGSAERSPKRGRRLLRSARRRRQSEPPPGVGPGIAVPSLAHLPDEAKAILRNTESYTFEPPKEQLVASMIEGVPKAAEPFIMSQWFLARTSGPALLTSDEPISLLREPTPENAHMGLGPANADAIQLPLGPDRYLFMLRNSDHPDRLGPIADGLVEGVNDLTVNGWWSQLFRHSDGPGFPRLPPPLPPRRVTTN